MPPFANSIPSPRWIATGLLAAALCVPLPSFAGEVIDIAAARALPLGTVVTVEGSVTVPSGTFSSSTFDEGFAIQDETAGIFVSIAADLHLGLRQRVRVTGPLADNGHGVLTVVPADAGDVEEDGRGRRVVPRREATGEISNATQGLLVRVEGTITQPISPDPPFGTIIEIDDGSGPIRIFVCTSTGIDLSGLAPGQRLGVTGLSYTFGDSEVDPRFQRDLHPHEH
jgi:hypothetical protein